MDPLDQYIVATYRAMLDALHLEGVLVRGESTALGWDSRYEPPPRPGVPPHIRVARKIGGPYFHEDAELFLASADDVITECMTVAHEFGHRRHTLDDLEGVERLEQIKLRLGASPATVSHAECDALYEDEAEAWARAKEILASFGFPAAAWPLFERERARALSTYEEACRLVADWTPDRALSVVAGRRDAFTDRQL